MYPNDRHDSGIDGDDTSGATLNRTPLRKVATRTSVCVPNDRHDSGIDGDDNSDSPLLIQLFFLRRDTYWSMASFFVGLWMPARSPRVTRATVLSVSMDAAG